MQFTTLEDFLAYLEESYNTPTEDTSEETTVPAFDNNTKALNVLFRNAMNDKAFTVAYAIIVYANEHQIILTKGH